MTTRKKILWRIYCYFIALIVCFVVDFGFHYFLDWHAHYYQDVVLAFLLAFILTKFKKPSQET